MKEDGTESIVFLGAGPMAAILLGLFLSPVRGVTSASNFAFLFMALTILVAEYGGRRAAIATALCSALSLDFFLTKPYLQLTIVDKHDVIAFFGLGACGLIAAAFGSQRGKRNAALAAAQRELGLLHAAIGGLESGTPSASRLGAFLDAASEACPIAAAVVRDEQNQVLAATGDTHVTCGIPTEILATNTLLPRGTTEDDQPHVIPASGARLPLTVGSRQVGWLDLWGNGLAASPQSRRTLGDAARILACLFPAPVRANH
jgi:K+-sensing histidine kinase KdpD